MAVTVAGAGARSSQRRQKQIVVVGGVLLVALLFFQVPRMMKAMDSGSTSTSTPATTPAPSAATGTVTPTPAPPAAAPAAVPTTPGAAPVPATSGKFISFGRFRTKDPFASQVSATTAASPSSASPAPAPAAQATLATPAPAPAAAPAQPTAFAASPAKAAKTATITLNGAEQQVAVGGTFPKSDPVFRLVSLTTTSAKVAIVDGKLKDGGASVTLEQGVPLTLMNTADGKRYVLRLVSAR